MLVVSSSFPRVSTSVPRGRKHCAVNIVGNLIGIKKNCSNTPTLAFSLFLSEIFLFSLFTYTLLKWVKQNLSKYPYLIHLLFH